MKLLPLALIAIAAVAVAGCTPRRSAYAPRTDYPNQQQQQQPTGGDGAISNVGTDDLDQGAPEELPESDMRSADEKVAAWINENNIPEEAKLCTIYFAFDRFSVDENARHQLDAIAEAAKRDGIVIVGYSDYYGSAEYNLTLSDKRAQAVKNYLNRIGSADTAKIHALGEQFAVQSGTKDQVSKDRKVIVVDGNAAR